MLTEDLERRFEYSKAFLDKAQAALTEDEKRTYSEVAIMLAFSFMEGTLSYVFNHFADSNEFDLYEKSIVLEKDIRIILGEPALSDTKFRSIEDRLQFVLWKFSGTRFDKGIEWWSGFRTAVGKRNDLMHPKGIANLGPKDAELALTSIISATDHLMKTVFGKRWPKAKKGLVTSVLA